MAGVKRKPDIMLDCDSFLKTLLVDFVYLMENYLGSVRVGEYVTQVGLTVGARIEAQYRQAGRLKAPISPQQYGELIVDLKQRIGGDFFLKSVSPSQVTVTSSSCPINSLVDITTTPALCRVTSSVFGGIAARNFGYAKVVIDESIARGNKRCKVRIFLKPTKAAASVQGDEYTAEMATVALEIREAAPPGSSTTSSRFKAGSLQSLPISEAKGLRTGPPLVGEELPATEKSGKLDRLVAVAKEISSGLELSRILSYVVQSAAELTGADGGTVAILDEKRHVINYPYHYNMPDELSKIEVPQGAGIAGHVMKTKEPIVLNDYPAHPDHLPAFSKAGVKSILAVPLMIGKRPVGALGLFGKVEGKKFSKEDERMALAVADQAAVAIDNARLFEETNERLRVQKKLIETAVSIATGLDTEKVLSQVVRHAAEVAGADAAMIAMLEEDKDVITFPYAYNLPDELSKIVTPRGKGLAAQVIGSGKPRIVNDYQSLPERNRKFAEAGITAVATVPLRVGGRCIGAIGVMDKGSGRRFCVTDIDVLTIISTQTAVAIENARLYEKLANSARQLEQRVRERTEALSRMYQESEHKSRELEKANLKLREVDRLKSEFLANMSHELRTPLNSIIGFSKLILDGLDGEINQEQARDLEIVHTNALELLRLIDDLLNLAKIEAGRMRAKLLKSDPAALIVEVVMSLRSTAGGKGLKLDYQVPEGIKPIKMDRGKIRQVLMNLIGNAIKFTAEGRVFVSVKQTGDETIFSVADTGIGLKSDQTEVVFDRFYQAAPSLAEAEGVGLGLTISKRFVEMHGGRIWVKSKYGAGSTFSFSLPNN